MTDLPIYPDEDAKGVPPQAQGPNEQAIVAAGMTVEQWALKHPDVPMGPAPEDIGQVTTDPPDGSLPEGPWPGLGTSADRDRYITDEAKDALKEEWTRRGEVTGRSAKKITRETHNKGASSEQQRIRQMQGKPATPPSPPAPKS